MNHKNQKLDQKVLLLIKEGKKYYFVKPHNVTNYLCIQANGDKYEVGEFYFMFKITLQEVDNTIEDFDFCKTGIYKNFILLLEKAIKHNLLDESENESNNKDSGKLAAEALENAFGDKENDLENIYLGKNPTKIYGHSEIFKQKNMPVILVIQKSLGSAFESIDVYHDHNEVYDDGLFQRALDKVKKLKASVLIEDFAHVSISIMPHTSNLIQIDGNLNIDRGMDKIDKEAMLNYIKEMENGMPKPNYRTGESIITRNTGPLNPYYDMYMEHLKNQDEPYLQSLRNEFAYPHDDKNIKNQIEKLDFDARRFGLYKDAGIVSAYVPDEEIIIQRRAYKDDIEPPENKNLYDGLYGLKNRYPKFKQEVQIAVDFGNGNDATVEHRIVHPETPFG